MDSKTREMVQGWVARAGGGDAAPERTARMMRDLLHIGTLAECRALVAEALAA